MGCTRSECPGSGTWRPIFVIRKRSGEKGLQVRLTEVAVCEFHKDAAGLADFLSDEGWDKLMRHLREAGKGSFLRNLTTLIWERAEGAKEDDECLPF